ncbi:MAG: hypothetical protein FJ087_18850 [Deltaproteobacteria bacterium]|nr:hypothetical protein [Deltaproteobacteria bacterium]
MTARTATLFLAIPLLALAVRSGNGAMTDAAFDLLHASVVLLVVAAMVPRAGRVEDLASKSLMPLAILAVGACAAFTFLHPPGVYLRIATPQEYLPWPVLAGVSGAIGVAAVLRRPGRLVAVALVAAFAAAGGATFAAAGAWVIVKSPAPEIDVWVWHRDGIAAMLAGASPYGITIPNIYGADTAFYGPGLVDGGRVLAGYPYPPLGGSWRGRAGDGAAPRRRSCSCTRARCS